MMRKRVLTAVVVMCGVGVASGAMAGSLVQGGGARMGGSGRVEVSAADCARLSHRYVPGADVAYTPGVDVQGRKVAPADLPGGSTLKVPTDITIDIDIDLAAKYGMGANGLYKGTGHVGKVEVKNGRAYFDGQPVTSDDQDALAAGCQHSGVK